MSWYDRENLDKDCKDWDDDVKEKADKYDREVKENARKYDRFEDE